MRNMDVTAMQFLSLTKYVCKEDKQLKKKIKSNLKYIFSLTGVTSLFLIICLAGSSDLGSITKTSELIAKGTVLLALLVLSFAGYHVLECKYDN